MKRRQAIAVIGIVLTLLSFGGSSVTAGDIHLEPEVLSPEDVPNPDLELVAEARGWTLAEAAAQQKAAEAVGAIAVRIAKDRPEVFVGSALSKTPGADPTIYVKGPADAFVLDLVAASDVHVIVADNQPYSFDELEARQMAVHDAIVDAGFDNVVTRTNITGAGEIPVAVGLDSGLSAAASHDVLAAVPAEFRSSVTLTVSDPAGFRDTTSFGGMWVTDSGTNQATSGWSVRSDITGETGVTTAGHAVSIDGIVHPGSGVHNLDHQDEHRGEWGDVEWHTTTVGEPPQFYASSTTIRSVLQVELRADISENESVCQYGRASNSRDCTLDVFDVSISCTLSGVFNSRLVQMDGVTTIVGDSGGPWFFNYKAFGSQKGHCQGLDAWSVADLYDEAIDVRLIIFE